MKRERKKDQVLGVVVSRGVSDRGRREGGGAKEEKQRRRRCVLGGKYVCVCECVTV